jgi:hypothetical protein
MPTLRIKTVVPGDLDRVYEQVTAFPVEGQIDVPALEERYGSLLERQGKTLTFEERGESQVKWRCTFDPPNQRIMRALDSSWSDRTDRFEPTGGGTLWTISWELKAQGLAAYTQWLVFHLREKKRAYQRLVMPIVTHFQAGGSAS